MEVLAERKLYLTKMHDASVENWMNMPAGCVESSQTAERTAFVLFGSLLLGSAAAGRRSYSPRVTLLLKALPRMPRAEALCQVMSGSDFLSHCPAAEATNKLGRRATFPASISQARPQAGAPWDAPTFATACCAAGGEPVRL